MFVRLSFEEIPTVIINSTLFRERTKLAKTVTRDTERVLRIEFLSSCIHVIRDPCASDG